MQKATRFEASFRTFDVNVAMQDLRTALFGVHGIAVRQHVRLWPVLVFLAAPSILANNSQRPLL